MLKVTLFKSLIGSHPRNRKTAYALGLRKIGQSNEFEDSAVVRGMIQNIQHLVKVEETDSKSKNRRRVVRAKKEDS